MKRILVVGASSFVGANLCVALRRKHRVFGTYNTHRVRVDDVSAFKLTIAPSTDLEAFVNFLKPDVLIYCAAVRDEARCQQDPLTSLFINAEGAAIMAGTLRRWGGRLIYFSTSKVFSGSKGGYLEEDPPDPTSAYGQTKYQGETSLETLENVFVLRLGTIYGMASKGQDSMFHRLLMALWNAKPTSLISDEYRSFVSIDDLTRFVELIVEGPTEAAGLYHVGSEIKESYFSFGQLVARVFGLTDIFTPISGANFVGLGFSAEDRGRDLTLGGNFFTRCFNTSPRDNEFSLRLLRMKLHKGHQ